MTPERGTRSVAGVTDLILGTTDTSYRPGARWTANAPLAPMVTRVECPFRVKTTNVAAGGGSHGSPW
jgi:hypothetical protein